MRKLVRLVLMIVLCCPEIAIADEVRGTVTLQSTNCPLPNLRVELDPPINSSQPKVITTTGQDGSFAARGLMSGRYLLVLYQGGTKVYQSELQVAGTATQSITLAPSGAPGGSPCSPPNTPNARLSLKGIEIKHNGSPFFSTSWHFDVLVNELKVGNVSEHIFDRNEKWLATKDWQPISVPATGVITVRLLGYQGGKKHADGSSKYTFGSGATGSLDVDVSCNQKSHGDFTFHFAVN